MIALSINLAISHAFVFIIQKHRHDSKDMFSYVDIMFFILFIPSTPQNIAKTTTDPRVECFFFAKVTVQMSQKQAHAKLWAIRKKTTFLHI